MTHYSEEWLNTGGQALVDSARARNTRLSEEYKDETDNAHLHVWQMATQFHHNT